MTRKLAAAVLLVGSLACHGIDPPSSSTPTADCSTLGQVQSVRTTLRDIYLWYKDLPDPSLTGFSSPEAYLEAVRYKALDTTYSYIANKAESDAFFSESQFIGVGISSRQTGPAELRISQVFPGGPAAEAGLARGDYLLAINGRAVGDLIRTGQIDTIFGANQIGVPVTLAWRSLPGAELQATITKRLVTIPTVSQTAVFDLPAARVGYVHLRNFVTPSTEALNVAFRALVDAGANELILDLRYNGGGLVSVAQHLGYDFCDKTLFPVAFEGRNARGEGGYFDGIPADCAAADDLDHPLGDSGEASLAEALRFLRTGRCSVAAAGVARAQAEREAQIGRGLPKDGWRQLVNAY
jgi:hypothetical protein